MPSAHILDYKPQRTGRTRRAIKTQVRLGPLMQETFDCTVPKGTPVAFIVGAWWVADFAWLEPLLGTPKGMERTSAVYHGAKANGVQVDEADVTGIR